LRQRGETPVIMLTALDQDLDKLTALRMGADDYVVKPFNPAEVRACAPCCGVRCAPRAWTPRPRCAWARC
jgi:two-component system response regulator AdeR